MAIAKWNPFGNTSSTPAPGDPKAPPAPKSSADGKQFGLKNFGNTCYANSVLQALYFCSPFRDLLIQSFDHSVSVPDIALPLPAAPVLPVSVASTSKRRLERNYSTSGPSADSPALNGTAQSSGPPIPPSPPSLFSALRSLFLHVSRHPSDKGTVEPSAFIDKLREVNELFRSTQHQDAHEFSNYLLNKIVEEMEVEQRKFRGPNCLPQEDLSNSVGTLSSQRPTTATATASSNADSSSSEATLVHKLFEGILTSETRCLTCETVSSRDESFLDLSLDIEQNSSVTACLRQFSASEMLCNRNKFFCDACCDLQEAEKRMKIKRLPNVLALHLKRFKYQEDGKYVKLAYRVAFPFQLRLFNTVDDAHDPDRLYELFAIVVHIGSGPHQGHYISIIKTMGSWLVFDDMSVDTIKESEIPKYFGDSNSGSAYVLYYQAADINLAELGLRSQTPKVETDVKELSASPLPLGPTNPPGLVPPLVPETEGSDTSEPSIPVTPSPSRPSATASTEKPAHDAPHGLTLNTGPHDDTSSSATSAPLSSAPSSPAVTHPEKTSRFPMHGIHTLRPRKSLKIRRPASAPGPVPPEKEPAPPVPVPPLDVAGHSKETPVVEKHGRFEDPPPHEKAGKTKEPERKASGWFRRKSRTLRPDTSHGTSPTSPLLSSSGGESFFTTPGHSPKQSRDESRHADSRASFGTAPPAVPKSRSQVERHRDADPPPVPQSPALTISSSSAASTSTTTVSGKSSGSSVDFPKHSVAPLSPIPSSPANHHADARGAQRALPVPPSSWPREPSSTAPGTSSVTPQAVASSPSVATPYSLIHENHRVNGVVPRHKPRTTAEASPLTLDELAARRKSMPGAGPAGTGTDASHTVGPPSESSASSSGTGLKKATRKLSLSAGLGFGKKDKDKDKDKSREHSKEKEMKQFAAPTAFSMSMGGRL